MRTFAIFILLPATLLLVAMTIADFCSGKDRKTCRAVVLGGIAGLVAAVAYDVFRLPFVFAKPLGISEYVPALNLFKVFPRFGAMLLGQPIEQSNYSPAAHLLGWAYHFSNGVTFGIMYLAMIGDARRHWAWAVLFAVGLEVAMLFTPYPAVFGIAVGGVFVAVTMLAHLIFGVTLGMTTNRFAVMLSRTRLQAAG